MEVKIFYKFAYYIHDFFQAKERELEQLVQSKEQALTQSERLRSHYRSQSHDDDVSVREKFYGIMQILILNILYR
jgi:hypothetical protein